MNDPNITMEEYIKLEEEKDQSRGEMFNWQITTFGRTRHYYEEERFMNFKEEFQAIIFEKIKEDGNGNMHTSPKPMVDYFDDLDYFKDFENEFPAIVYNDGLTSKSDLGTKPLVISKCIIEFNLIDETSLSEYNEEIVSRFNDLFNDIHHDDLKSEKDDGDDDISIIQSSKDNEISHGEKSYYGMLLFLIINLYVSYRIPFDPKRYYKDGSHTNVAEAKMLDPVEHDMAPLTAVEQRHPWLRYKVEGYTPDFEGLIPKMRQDLAVRLRMVYSREGQQVFVIHAWRRLFGIRGPLVREFILDFLSTYRMNDTEMGLVVVDTLCFQLGGARRRMTWRQFILALGLHTKQEMAEAGFGAYWAGSDRLIPDKGDLRDY
ncbi:hypothetical protein Tco_0681741 [Tanacetum coccineum]|uniref:Uncharacterized protein n=1 Tax=Tanacetum coccineum TaxID=301880 RepID=A0ABQ4XQ37_9ASTR